MIDFYTTGTGNGHRAAIALEESGLPYRTHKLNLAAGDARKPEYVAINPGATIPAIVDQEGPGGKPLAIAQSGAIALYLAEKSGKLLPKDPARRGAALHWFMFAWDDWTGTVVESTSAEPLNLFDGLPQDRTSTRDTLAANAGAECLFHGEGFVVPLRFGAAWEPQGGRSPYTRDPVDYVMVAAGTGYNTNSLKFDAALQYRWTTFRDGANFELDEPGTVYLPRAVGERQQHEWRLKFSLILRVTNTEKLRGTIRKIFGGGA